MPGLDAVCAALAVAAFAYIPHRGVAVAVAAVLAIAAFSASVRTRRLVRHRRADAPRVVRWADEGRETLGRHIQEHRRYHRHLAVLRLHPGTAGPGELMRALYPRLRVGTSVWLDRNDVLIISPSTDRAAARGMLDRLSRELGRPRLTQESLVAVFPDDALTTGALLHIVTRKALQDRMSADLPVADSGHTIRYADDQAAADPVDQSAS